MREPMNFTTGAMARLDLEPGENDVGCDVSR
jgi:hypothetical protein